MTPINSEGWTEEEDELMRLYYPDKLQIEVMQALPQWAWNRIVERAQVLRIRGAIVPSLNYNGPHKVNMYHRTVRYHDLTAAEQLMQGEEEKQRICYIVNRLAQQTLRGSTSAHWFLLHNSSSYAGLEAAFEDDGEKLYVSAAACESRHRSVIYGATINLTRLREITQDLAQLFGLALPVPLEKAASRR